VTACQDTEERAAVISMARSTIAQGWLDWRRRYPSINEKRHRVPPEIVNPALVWATNDPPRPAGASPPMASADFADPPGPIIDGLYDAAPAPASNPNAKRLVSGRGIPSPPRIEAMAGGSRISELSRGRTCTPRSNAAPRSRPSHQARQHAVIGVPARSQPCLRVGKHRDPLNRRPAAAPWFPDTGQSRPSPRGEKRWIAGFARTSKGTLTIDGRRGSPPWRAGKKALLPARLGVIRDRRPVRPAATPWWLRGPRHP